MRQLPPEALYALSADPWTNEDSEILEKTRRIFSGRVAVGIATDPRRFYDFAQWERRRLVQKSLGIPADDVKSIP